MPENSDLGPGDDATGRSACETVRLLVPWYAANRTALDRTECEEVEAHVGSCEACARRLSFALRLAEGPPPAGWHPEETTLTDYVDAPQCLGAAVRARLDAHLAACPVCAESVAALRALAPPDTPPESGPRPGMWARLWRILSGGLLRPVPAAAYLVTAVAAGVLLISTYGHHDGLRTSGGDSGAWAWMGSPRILVDGSGIDRSIEQAETGAFVRTDARELLLVEFTNLMTPPDPEGLYGVRIQPADRDEVVWASSVAGRTFADNYTLSVVLEAGVLSPGAYRLMVLSPEGEVIFRSGFVAGSGQVEPLGDERP